MREFSLTMCDSPAKLEESENSSFAFMSRMVLVCWTSRSGQPDSFQCKRTQHEIETRSGELAAMRQLYADLESAHDAQNLIDRGQSMTLAPPL
jgi:hypothetical protein